MRPHSIGDLDAYDDRSPAYALVEGVDLVVIRFDEEIRVLYGRCQHRGALMADGFVEGNNIICGLHRWDYRLDNGVSEYNNGEALQKFDAWLEDGKVFVDADQVAAWRREHPQPYRRDEYLGLYQDVHATEDEPYNSQIQAFARDGLSKVGHHGPMAAMGVSRTELPSWNDLQFVTAQLHTLPLMDDEPVDTTMVIGPEATKPLVMQRPMFVSDMSFGALSAEAKISLATGAQMAGTGICSGEGGMMPEEQAANTRYLYELASGRFGWSIDKVKRVQAFHFKAGQGAKTGTGGHLPGHKVMGRIAEVRGLKEGEAAVSPSRFPDLNNAADYRRVADEVREGSGGIPIGFKLSAQHIELDIDFALSVGCDYIIMDGRGGATGAAPIVFRDNISVPTIAAVARARRHLDRRGRRDVTFIATGGLRTPADFAKAMALGADGVAVSNAALQAIGCLGMRACHTNNCPVGIATQQDHLRKRLQIQASAKRLSNWFEATTHLMQVLARAMGHQRLADFCVDDLTTFHRDMAALCGVSYGGIGPV